VRRSIQETLGVANCCECELKNPHPKVECAESTNAMDGLVQLYFAAMNFAE
jgi:hypothetical protein